MTSSKKIIIGIGVIVVIGIAVGAVVSFQTPDFDAIIENKDCGAILGLTEGQLEKATLQQQLGIAGLAAACVLAPP